MKKEDNIENKNEEIEFKCDCRSCSIISIGQFGPFVNEGCPVCGSYKIELYSNCD